MAWERVLRGRGRLGREKGREDRVGYGRPARERGEVKRLERGDMGLGFEDVEAGWLDPRAAGV